MKEGVAKEEAKGKIFTLKQAKAEEEFPQLEVTPKKVTQIEIEEIRLKLWNSSRSILGPEDIRWEMLKQ